MMSAKDFFYKNYSTSAKDAVYAENYHHFSEQQKQEIRHTVRWSNDRLIERYMEELISVAPSDFRNRIELCFVGKIRNFTANAVALPPEGEHYGELIFFNVGLSDACFQYAIMFVELTKSINQTVDGEIREHILNHVDDNIAKIAAAQLRWNIINEVALTDEDVLRPRDEDLDVAVGIAVMIDKFVLYHEICHHLLGHTSSWGDDFIDALSEGCKAWLRPVSDAHKREFQADAGAILLALWASKNDSRLAEITAALGALLFFTTIGQFAPDAWVASETHPSEGDRFTQCCNILIEIFPEKSDLGSILKDIFIFQSVLSKSQGHGIGSGFSRLKIERRVRP